MGVANISGGSNPASGQINVFLNKHLSCRKKMKRFGLLCRLTATAFALLHLWRGAKPRGDGIVCEFFGKPCIDFFACDRIFFEFLLKDDIRSKLRLKQAEINHEI